MRVVLEERISLLSIESVIVLLVVVLTTLVDTSFLHAASFSSHDDELSFSSSFDSASPGAAAAAASSSFKFDDLSNTAEHLSQPVLGKYTELKFDAPAEELPSSSKSGKIPSNCCICP